MSHQAHCHASNRTTVRKIAAVLLMSAVAALLGGCDSGSGGRDVTIGSGQNMDPVTLDFPVFYIKRPVPDPENDELTNADARELLRFVIGADLYMRDRASISAPEVNLTADITQGLGDIRDLDVNYDGSKVIFSMRARFIEGADEEDQPTWNIWEYDVAEGTLRRVIPSDIVAEEGHDIMPHYLPDGRIVFSSTRQQASRAILLDENKPQFAAQDEDDNEPAFVLHVMDADGTNIRQISFNQSHDLDPAVLQDGRIVFSRWEHHIDDNQFDLYTIRPDGTDLQLLYGANSHQTGSPNPPPATTLSTIQFMMPRPMQDGRTLSLVRPFRGTGEAGDLILIDTATYVDNTRAAAAADIGMTGPAQTRALPTDVRTIPGPSPGGRYRAAMPLFDGTGRLLVSWSQCRLMENNRIVPCTAERLRNPQAVEAPPLYGIYVYDVRDNTQRPIVVPQEGFMYTEVVSGSQRQLPTVIPDRVAGVDFPTELLTESVGILNIRSVYDIDGVDTAPGGIAAVSDPANPAYANRPARFLRVEKAVSIPDNNTYNFSATAFGPNRSLGMREILGYAPIEPDGSVKVKVPANVAFSISVLDANGRRLGGVLGGRHTNWLQLQPGEQVTCNGCHNGNPTTPMAHGRRGMTESVYAGAQGMGVAFPNTNPQLWAELGETMAETRGRIMCGGACPLSVDLAFRDYWLATPPTENEVDACYASGPNNVLAGLDAAGAPIPFTCTNSLPTGAALPVAPACRGNINSLCRITIHYPTHIHPLWSVDRFVDADGDGIPDVDGDGNVINNRCDSCHARTDAAGMAMVPAGQLDLSDGLSDEQPLHLKSYRELLFADRAEELNDTMTDLQEICLREEIDPITNVATCVEFQQVAPSMSAAGARASARFFNKMESTAGTVPHRDFMSPSELRLVSEWLDIGAQYFNDPFTAPEN
jgi:hypothetical protein